MANFVCRGAMAGAPDFAERLDALEPGKRVDAIAAGRIACGYVLDEEVQTNVPADGDPHTFRCPACGVEQRFTRSKPKT